MKPRDRFSRRGKGWLGFGVGVAAIWLFVFVIAPWLQALGPIGRLHGFVRERHIDATALYYTEIEQFDEAEFAVRNNLEYSP